MKRRLLLCAACLAVVFLGTTAMAGSGTGPNPGGPAAPQPTGPSGPDITDPSGNGSGPKGPMGGWGKFCQGDCDEGTNWQDVCKGTCLADGCVLEDGPIPQGVWEELFGTGGEGSAGSTIAAYGKAVWSFTGASICEGCVTPVAVVGWPECYLTVYTGGTFALDIPCLDAPLTASDVTAYNYTCKDASGMVSFMITFSGPFAVAEAADDGAPQVLTFSAVGQFAGRPDILTSEPDEEDNSYAIGMGGTLDNVTLVLTGEPEPPEPDAEE